MALAEWWCKTGLDRNELESKFISKEIGNYFFLLFCCFFPQFTVFVLKIHICFIHYLFSSALYVFFHRLWSIY